MSRVVIVQDYVPSYRVAFFEMLADRAKSVGIAVSIAAAGPGAENALRRDRADLTGVLNFERRDLRIFGRRLAVRNLSEVIRSADLVILEQARRNLDAYRALRSTRPPMVALWGHGRDYTRKAGRLSRGALEWLTARADWMFVYTGGGVAPVSRMGMPTSRVTVVQNSLDTAGIQNRIARLSDSDRDDFERRLGLVGRTAIFLGALDGSKRLDVLLASAEVLSRNEPGFRLLIAGDGPLRGQVERRVGELPAVRILGRVDGDTKALALLASRAIVMPGRVGLVAVESFASGVPLVTTDWPYHAPEFEYLEPGVNAIVTADDLDSFTTGVRSLIVDDELHDRLSDGCRRSAEHYTLDHMVTNFLSGIIAALEAGPR
jgi:glycosyltransferase involved in cell wall biosynthesis